MILARFSLDIKLFLRARNLHNLLNYEMQRLALDGVGCFVVDLFAFATAGDEAAGFEEL